MLNIHAMPMIAWVQAIMTGAGLQAMMLPPIPMAKRIDPRAEGQPDG